MPLWTLFGLLRERRRRAGLAAAMATARKACWECPGSIRRSATSAARRAPRSVRPARSSSIRSDRSRQRLEVDYGRCVVCQLCVEACPTGAVVLLFRLGVGRRPSVPISASARRRGCRAARTATPNPGEGSAAACTSAMSTPAPATAANPNCRRSTIPSTISIGSAFSSRLRRVSPICCSSPAPSPTRCANPCCAPTKRCRSLDGSWRSATCAVSGGVAGGGYACGNRPRGHSAGRSLSSRMPAQSGGPRSAPC